jgi:ribose-phosphate pyrophosphokinase
MFELLHHLRVHKVKSIRIACTHGLFAAGAAARLSEQPDVSEIVCTNTVPIAPGNLAPKLKVLSIAKPLAEAMRRIHDGESVSALFHA